MTAVFTLGREFKFSVEGKSDEEIYRIALPLVEQMKHNEWNNVYMYVNNTIERIWNYKIID
jgi:hypothetical protein